MHYSIDNWTFSKSWSNDKTPLEQRNLINRTACWQSGQYIILVLIHRSPKSLCSLLYCCTGDSLAECTSALKYDAQICSFTASVILNITGL